MARQSRWQQFSNAFNSTYGLVTDTAQDFQAAGIMRNEFEDDEGNPLSGDALKRRRYSELADLRARYGDVEGAMGLRAQQENLRSTRFANDINAENREHISRQTGPLQTRAMESEIRARDALTAKRSGGGAGGGGAVPGTAGERLQLMRAQALQGAFGGGGAGAPSAPEENSAQPRRTSPSRPSAPAPPSTPSALPRVQNPGGATANPASAPAPSSAPPEPTQVSTRGGLSGANEIPTPPTYGAPSTSVPVPGRATEVRAEGEQGLSGRPNPAGGVMTEGPNSMSAPEQDDPVRILREGIESSEGGTPDRSTLGRAEDAASNQSSMQLERGVNALLATGDIEGAQALVDLADSLGENRASAVTRRAADLQANLDTAYRRGGTAGVLQVLDADNGPGIDIRLVENEDGTVSAVDFVQGKPVRTIASAPNADALGEELYTHGMDPASAIEYERDKLARREEEIALEQREQEVPGETYKERLLWQLERDPYNEVYIQAYATELGLMPEDVIPALEEWRAVHDREAEAAIEAAAKGGGNGGNQPAGETTGAGGNGGLAGGPNDAYMRNEQETGSDATAFQQWARAFGQQARGAGGGGVGSPRPEITSSGPDRAMRMQQGLSPEGTSRPGASGGTGQTPPESAGRPPSALVEQMYARLRSMPSNSGVPDQRLMEVAERMIAEEMAKPNSGLR